MTEVLRNQWGFKGFVVTDYTAINEMINHGVGDLQTVSAMALNAGVDMDMVGEGFLRTIPESLEQHKVTLDKINEACRLILEAKYNLGLFNDPYLYCDTNRVKNDVFTPENKNIARNYAPETFVLLKNDNNILPLKKTNKIAIIGPLANMKENMVGSWSVAADFSKNISLLMGLDDSKINYQYAQGCEFDYNPEFIKNVGIFGKPIKWDGRSADEMFEEAKNIALNSDIVVLTLGESAEMSGESSSMSDIRIPQSQRDLIYKISKLNKPVVLVLFNGRPLDLSEELPLVDAVLDVWFPGTEAGNSIVDALFGDANPSGKLTTSFPRNLGQVPIYYSHKNTGRSLSNDALKNCKFEKFRSNYLDICNTPLFPFGYGLSYTNFEYSNLKLSNDKLNKNGKINITVDVSNTGGYDGKEIVQLYIRDIVGSVTRPVKELKGFEKIFIKKGETKTVSFSITTDDLKFYDYNLNYIAEPGEFEVFVGGNSEDVMTSKFMLE
ncbi:MAG: glycoside hydrolase family 3 C-terminal domain-containing protein [Saprospiraceae bacterium]